MNTQWVFRTTSEPVAAEKLSAAFGGVPGLTPLDATTTGGDGYGIVGRGLTAEQAAALQANLAAAGVETEIVEAAQIPPLPSGEAIGRVKFTPKALRIVDVLGNESLVEWSQIKVIAAGSVQWTKFKEVDEEVGEVRLHWHPAFINVGLAIPLPVPMPLPAIEISKQKFLKGATDWFLRAEIILADARTRYSINAEKFDFTCLGEQFTRNLAGDFCQFVRDLVSHAPTAALNRGAEAIIGEPQALVYYPRKNLYYDELIWMLWQAKRKSAAAALH